MSNFRLPRKNDIRSAISSFSKKEYFMFLSLALVLTVSTIVILEKINKSFMVEIPTRGGDITEGILGSPRFINPALAIGDADNDLVSLVYSGLTRKDTTGNLVPDLASKYEISKDKLVYTFTLKDNIYFHDNTPVTAKDVVFTINEIKNPAIKSPIKANWDGITVKEIDPKTVEFNLKQPYASFLENTTLGILPEHLWVNTTFEINDLNTNPIGSGPYKINSMSKQSSGIISSYTLLPFKNFVLGRPYIKSLTLRFYQNENELVSALTSGEVNQISSISPKNADILKNDKYKVETSVLPRVFGLFFNQNENQLFTNRNAVKAIDLAIDKERIVREVLGGYGVVIDDPIPPNMIEYQKLNQPDSLPYLEKLTKAQDILEKDGWKKNTEGILEKTTLDKKKKKSISVFKFSISTGNAPELTKAATLIQEDLAKLGIKVEVKNFEIGNLNQSVIRPRKYDALLFGQIINRESDLFAFWHSSQRKDPGLNVAMYTNAKVDKILEDAFVTTDPQARIKKYAQFEDEVEKDTPAVFLYSPNFIYVVSKNLKGLSIDHLNSPSDRFWGSYLWYTKTDSIWKIFSK